MKEMMFNSEIYSPDNIDSAVNAYNGYAKIRIKVKKERVYVSFSKCRYDEATTVMEFENYLIALENRSL